MEVARNHLLVNNNSPPFMFRWLYTFVANTANVSAIIYRGNDMPNTNVGRYFIRICKTEKFNIVIVHFCINSFMLKNSGRRRCAIKGLKHVAALKVYDQYDIIFIVVLSLHSLILIRVPTFTPLSSFSGL